MDVPLSTEKKVVNTNGNGGQDGGHHHKYEEHRDTPHIGREKRGSGEEGTV